MLRRFVPFVVLAGLSTFFLFTVFQRESWRRLPQSVGLGEAYGPVEDTKAKTSPGLETSGRLQDERLGQLAKGAFREPKVESNSPYSVGLTKPAGSNYTKCLVVPRLREESTNWIEEELGDMLESGLLSTAVYVVNDRSAPLHPPKNKGHEVMVYLSYIIDSYEQLADTNIFMHAHRFAWHNNELLSTDASLMVRNLSPERVARDGYMNLRCHWDPGCPLWLHPGAVTENFLKPEEWLIADSWAELFPLDPIPSVLAQPCCAQFAVSRERILATPKKRYMEMRDWILRTELSDYLSGRVFEYLWQYIFTASSVHCPSMSACYCDGYGLCFGSPQSFDYWFKLRHEYNGYEEELRIWQAQAVLIETARQRSSTGKLVGEEPLEVPEAGLNKWLMEKMARVGKEMEDLKRNAFELGRDPKQRALEAGREWGEGGGL
ncbi:hypothetical protein LTR08_003876 [Meristemomyces frigidus]|nr:hypothetical protein LTR08_003876 [Meristemomyces frigidus]